MEVPWSPSSSECSSSSKCKVETQARARRSLTLRFYRSQDVTGIGRLSRYIWNGLVLNTWFLEILAMLLSVSCMIAIFVVLKVYDGRSIPQLPYGITLNALISILATASKTALLYLVGSALSQLKWCWFQKDRRVQDIQSFDDASRGPWGSVILLLELKWRSFASIGALVTILALAFDPFVQQVLRYPARYRIDKLQSTSVRSVQDFTLQRHEVELKADIELGIWADPDTLRLAPSCPSGHCQWHEYPSFEWCTKCVDATDIASVTCNANGGGGSRTCSLSFGQGADTSNTFRPTPDRPHSAFWSADFQSVWPIYQIKQAFSPSQSISTSAELPPLQTSHPRATYFGLRSPLLVIGHAAWRAWGHGENITQSHTKIQSAEQCVLTPCLKHYNVSVHHGVPVVDVIDVNYGTLKQYFRLLNRGGSCSNAISLCWEAGSTQPSFHDLDSAHGKYKNVTAGVFCAAESCFYEMTVVDWIAQRLTGYGKWIETAEGFMGPLNYPKHETWGYYNDVIQALLAKHNLSSLLANVAESFSQQARKASTETVPGWVYTNESFVRVRWEWLILPFVLHVAGLVVLIIAILSSRYHKARLWKASLLPLLYHGMEKKERSVATDVQGMEEEARRDIVSLDQSSADRIILQSSGSVR